MLLDGADQFARKLNNTSQLNVFLAADSSNETIKIAEKQLTELFDGEITFIDQDKGLKELSKNLEFSELVKNLDTNPIPQVLRGIHRHSNKHATGKIPKAQCAFKILMIHEVLQFALRIAFRCVLHRCGNLDIHR